VFFLESSSLIVLRIVFIFMSLVMLLVVSFIYNFSFSIV